MTAKPVIHVGVDGSWRDTGALEWALQESLLRHEPLQAVHVIEDKAPARAGLGAGRRGRLRRWSSSARSRSTWTRAPAALDHEADLVVGPPARTLTEVAAGSRMLVVGRRGMGTFKRLLIGSTSEAVAATATVPVVIVPEHWKPGDHSGPVLVAVDDTDEQPGGHRVRDRGGDRAWAGRAAGPRLGPAGHVQLGRDERRRRERRMDRERRAPLRERDSRVAAEVPRTDDRGGGPPRPRGRRRRHGGDRMPTPSSWSSAPATTPG